MADSATVQLMITSYHELAAICEEQLQIAYKERYDEQIKDIQKYEKLKIEKSERIQECTGVLSGYQSLSAETKAEMQSVLEKLLQLNEQLQHIINSWYSEDSKTMRQVNVQRKTLQVYGGMNDPDYISYYIDDKK